MDSPTGQPQCIADGSQAALAAIAEQLDDLTALVEAMCDALGLGELMEDDDTPRADAS